MHRPPRYPLPLQTIKTLNNHHLPHPHPPLIVPRMPPPLPRRLDSPTLHPPPIPIQNVRSHQIPLLYAPRVRHSQRRRPYLLDGPPYVEDLPSAVAVEDGVGFGGREGVVETEEGAGVGLVDVRVVEGAAGGGVVVGGEGVPSGGGGVSLGWGTGGGGGEVPERRAAADFVVEREGAGGACAVGISDTSRRSGWSMAAYSVFNNPSHSG